LNKQLKLLGRLRQAVGKSRAVGKGWESFWVRSSFGM